MQAVYRNQLGNGSLSAQQQLAMLQQQQYLQQLAAAGHLNGFPGGPGYVFNPGAAQDSYLALNLAGQNGVPVVPVPYYAGVPWYPPAPGLVQQSGGTARPPVRPPSPTGSQSGSSAASSHAPQQDSAPPSTPYQVIPAYYDAKGTLVQLAGGAVPPVRLLPSPAPHLPPTFSSLATPHPVNLGSPISSISSSTFSGRRDSLDRTSNPPFSPSVDHFTKTKGGWGGGLTSYGAVGSIASPGLAGMTGMTGSTGSLTPPPSIPGLNLGLFGVNSRLAPGADRAFPLSGGLYPAARTPTLATNTMGAIPFSSLITGGKSRHNSSSIEKNSNRSRLLEDFR